MSGSQFTASNVTHYHPRRLVGTWKALNYTHKARRLCSGNINHADPFRTCSYLYQIIDLVPVSSALSHQEAHDRIMVPRNISYRVFASSKSKCRYPMHARGSSLGSVLLSERRL